MCSHSQKKNLMKNRQKETIKRSGFYENCLKTKKGQRKINNQMRLPIKTTSINYMYAI